MIKRVLVAGILLFLMPYATAADNTTVEHVGNYSDAAGISFLQYIIDVDMSYADEILIQETWTLSGEGNTAEITLSVPQDAIVMRFQKQDMSNAAAITDLEYTRTGDILYFSDDIPNGSSVSPQLYSLLYLLPEKSDGQFTKTFTVPGYNSSSIHSLILNVKTNEDFEPLVVDGNGIPLSSNSKREGNITTFFFSHPSFNEITVSLREKKVSNNTIYISALFFIAGLLALGGAIYINKRNKGVPTDTDVQELEYRYAAVQKVLSTIDSDLKDNIIDENIHSLMSAKYRKEASEIKKELDKKQKS